MTGPGIYPRVYHRASCPAVKNKGEVGLFQISQKERLFHVLYQPSYNLTMWSPFTSLLHPSKKGLSFLLGLGKKRIYLETQLKGEFTDLF